MPIGFWLALLVQASILIVALSLAGNFLRRAVDAEEDAR